MSATIREPRATKSGYNQNRSRRNNESKGRNYERDNRGERQQHSNRPEWQERPSNNERYERSSHANLNNNNEHTRSYRNGNTDKRYERTERFKHGGRPPRTPRTSPEHSSFAEAPTQSKIAPSASVDPSQSVFNSDKFFKDMGISEALSSTLADKGFIHPSKAQAETLPIILADKNLICSSETGSGKTLAFAIPILEKLFQKKIDQACILTPTREIAIQIESVIKPLAYELGLTTGLVIGGLNMLVQKKILRHYPQIIIGTPGRLVDVLTQGLLWLDYTQIVVLDEVDRMLDMGFEKEITILFENFPTSAQILMFTATMNKELEKISQKYVKNYELVKIGDTMKTKKSIEHLFLTVTPKEKYDLLKRTLLRKNNEKVLVFCNSISDTSNIFRKLKKDRLLKIECLHSKKSQSERNHVLNGFRADRINHLLTTDVLARGIDIPNIGAVINYELPYDPEDYIHRIGRTGRADYIGKALSFVDAKSELKLKKIKKLIKSDSGFNFIEREALETF